MGLIFQCFVAKQPSTRVAVASVLVIFIGSLTALFLVYKTFPKVTE